jgi:hypothetical protein
MSNREDPVLPRGFEALAPWAASWALPTEQARYAHRLATPIGQVRAFHAAILPRMDDVMQCLAAYPADDTAALAAPVRRLFHLALAYFEASTPVELNWRSSDLDAAFPASRIVYQPPSNRAD